MTQDMHTWIAMLLIWLIVIFVRREAYLPITDDVSAISLCIHIAMGILFFAIWFLRII